MATPSLWISFGGVAAVVVALIFTSVGMTLPWWTQESTNGEFPVLTEVTLWISMTTSFKKTEDRTHFGCKSACDRTQVGRVQVIKSCFGWGELCSDSGALCKSSVGWPVSPGRNEADGAEASQPDWSPAPAGPPAPSPPLPEYAVAPSLPKTDSVLGLTTSTTPMQTTGKRTTTMTTTSTSFTTRTTQALTAWPGTTRQFLRPGSCPVRTAGDHRLAEFTPWELAFSLEYPVYNAIYTQLRSVLSRIPPELFDQRPLEHDMVRLCWEVTFVRTLDPQGWLYDEGRQWCPSAPAETLHFWLSASENEKVFDSLKQAMVPADVEPVSHEDPDVRDAWERQAAGLIQTTAPLFEEGSAAQEAWRPATTTLPVLPTLQPDIPVASVRLPTPRMRRAPASSVATCQKARSDGGLNLPLWHQDVQPCDMEPVCAKLWLLRLGLVARLILGLVHCIPTTLSFIGSQHRFHVRFPAKFEIILAALGAFALLVALLVSVAMGLPVDDRGEGLVLNGVGFACTVVAFLSSLASLVCAVAAKAVHLQEEVQAFEDEIEEQPEGPPVTVTTSARSLAGRCEKSPPPVLAAPPLQAAIAWGEPPEPETGLDQLSLPLGNLRRSGRPLALDPMMPAELMQPTMKTMTLPALRN